MQFDKCRGAIHELNKYSDLGNLSNSIPGKSVILEKRHAWFWHLLNTAYICFSKDNKTRTGGPPQADAAGSEFRSNTNSDSRITLWDLINPWGYFFHRQ